MNRSVILVTKTNGVTNTPSTKSQRIVPTIEIETAAGTQAAAAVIAKITAVAAGISAATVEILAVIAEISAAIDVIIAVITEITAVTAGITAVIVRQIKNVIP